MVIEIEDLEKLREQYKTAVENENPVFFFKRNPVMTSYAKYLIEHLENEKKRLKMEQKETPKKTKLGLSDLPEGYWNFVEKFLPNYYGRDDVHEVDVLNRYVNDELNYRDKDDYEYISRIQRDYPNPKEQLEALEVDLFLEAVENCYEEHA